MTRSTLPLITIRKQSLGPGASLDAGVAKPPSAQGGSAGEAAPLAKQGPVAGSGAASLPASKPGSPGLDAPRPPSLLPPAGAPSLPALAAPQPRSRSAPAGSTSGPVGDGLGGIRGLGEWSFAARIRNGRTTAPAALLELMPTDDDPRLSWPVPGNMMGRGFGYVRNSQRERCNGLWRRPHNGVDIPAPTGTPVVAPRSGVVLFAGSHPSFGNAVVLLHPDGSCTTHVHLDSIEESVRVGGTLIRGQHFAAVGDTGVSRGAHLHMELHHDGRPQDPVPLFIAADGEGPRARHLRASEEGSDTHRHTPDSQDLATCGDDGGRGTRD